MPYNPYERMLGRRSGFPWATYGVEVEAERLIPTAASELATGESFSNPLLRQMTSTYWNATADGSLRHNGVEFVSKPLGIVDARAAFSQVYVAMKEGLFRPSVRTGIHIHANVGTLDSLELREVMRTYAVLEPLLFRFVGPEREQNIYCVPLYRAANEQRNWRALAAELSEPTLTRTVLSRLINVMRSFCKYSALNLESFMRFGTVEFRHAPTFEHYEEAERWLRLVDAVMHFRIPQGEVTVRVEKDGRIVNGSGADTDIVIASAKAYLNALNRLRQPEQRQHPQLGADV
jgi:hypothetical protein